MSRKPVKKRVRAKDNYFQSQKVSLLIHMLMKDGKKLQATNIVKDALYLALEKLHPEITDENEKKAKILELLDQVLEKAGPTVEVKTKRIGGANYPVPVPVPVDRRTALAFRWLIRFARKHKEQTMSKKLAREILDVLAERGATIAEKLNMKRMAEANKAFAHLGRM